MDEDYILKILKEFGLNDKESAVYLSNLKIGSSRVNNIARDSKILRETAYFVLNSLIQKGLVSYVIKSKIKHFEASSPNKLISILKERQEKINSILPQLLLLEKSVKQKPKVELFEGKDGVKTIIDDLIKTKKQILTFSSTKSLIDKLAFYFPNYMKRRIKEKISIRVLTEKTKETIILKNNGYKDYREVRFLSKKYNLPNAVYIYGDKISIIDLEKNLMGLIIKNSDLNKTFRTIFEIAWDAAKK